jgi:hypothetical protein
VSCFWTDLGKLKTCTLCVSAGAGSDDCDQIRPEPIKH